MARVLCECCGGEIRDDKIDLGGGLWLRTTERGVEFRVVRAPDGHWPGTAWTPGISRQALAAFLGVRLQP